MLALEWLEFRWVPSTLPVVPALVGTPVDPGPEIGEITNNGPVAAGTPVTLNVSAQPAAGVSGPLTYQFDFFDNDDFEVSNQTGVASWTYDEPGLYALDVRVTDSEGVSSDALTFVIVTTPAPAVTAPADQPAVEGTTTDFALGRFSQTGGTGPWDVTVDWGDSSPDSTFVTTTTGSLGSLPHDFAKYGTYPVTVSVSDGQQSGSATFHADVADAAPAVTAPADQTATEGSQASFSLGQFADPGAESPWIVTVDWGDGTPPTVFGAGATGDLGTAPHTYAKYGAYPVTVTVNDGLETGSATFHVAVADVAPTVTPPSEPSATEGTTSAIALGKFADPGADSPWLVTVDWGDSSPASTFMVTSPGDLGSLSHDFGRFGTYTVTVTVNDGQQTGSAKFLTDVADVAPTVTAPADQSEALGTTANLELGRFSDPGSDLLWVVTVNWGDQTTPSSFVDVSPGSLGSLGHEYPSVGKYTATVTVGDGAGTGSATFMVAVAQATATLSNLGQTPEFFPPALLPPGTSAGFPIDPTSLLAGFPSISVGAFVLAEEGQGGPGTGSSVVFEVSTRVAQSFLSAAGSVVIVVDFAGDAPPAAAKAAAAAKGGANAGVNGPVVVVEVALPANVFAANVTNTTTTTTTTTTAANAGAGAGAGASTFPPPIVFDPPNPGGGAVTTVVLVLAFMNQQQVPRGGAFSFSRCSRRGNSP